MLPGFPLMFTLLSYIINGMYCRITETSLPVARYFSVEVFLTKDWNTSASWQTAMRGRRFDLAWDLFCGAPQSRQPWWWPVRCVCFWCGSDWGKKQSDHRSSSIRVSERVGKRASKRVFREVWCFCGEKTAQYYTTPSVFCGRPTIKATCAKLTSS